MPAGGGQPEEDLERVVDEPLRAGQGADHEDADGQAVPEALEADVAVDAGHGLERALALCHEASVPCASLPFTKEGDQSDIPLRWLLSSETMTSAGWLTTAAPMPAM
jgi:hypothetical protein